MSRKTRTHPDRRERPNAPPIARVAPGHYRTSDGIDIVNMNDGKRDACWVARKDGGKVLATDGTLRGVRRKLERLGDALALARKIAAP